MKRSKVFTLVELLVVVAIISILIAMLAPTINRARESAKQASCKASLRGIGQSLITYASDNKDRFPRFQNEYGMVLLLSRKYIDDPQTFVCPTVSNELWGDSDELSMLIKDANRDGTEDGGVRDPGIIVGPAANNSTANMHNNGNGAPKFPILHNASGVAANTLANTFGFKCTSEGNRGEWKATGHLAYLYAGGDSVSSISSTTPMMRDMDQNHQGYDYGSVLMGDGSATKGASGLTWWEASGTGISAPMKTNKNSIDRTTNGRGALWFEPWGASN
jgi:prepilin-type N-terminal cleavage/methylation domain-containing protein